MSEEKTKEIIDSLITFKLLDAELYRKKRVLTSQSIQERYILAKKHVVKNQAIGSDLDLVSDLKP